MQRTPHRCPCCSQPLGISWDLWGQFYACQDCGFTAEDDDELERQPGREPVQVPAFLSSLAQSYRLWQPTPRR